MLKAAIRLAVIVVSDIMKDYPLEAKELTQMQRLRVEEKFYKH